MDRREFIKSSLGLAGLVLVPSLRAQNPKNLRLNVNIDKLDGDLLSTDYHSNGKNSIISHSLDRVKNFYENAGKNYRLPGVNIEMNDSLKQDGDYSFTYTTDENFMSEIRSDSNLIENIFGKTASERVRAQGLDYIARQMMLNKFLEDARSRGGSSIPGKKKAFAIARNAYNEMDASKPQIRENATAILTYIIAHEIGHLFGLEHTEEAPQSTIMTTRPSKNTILNPYISEEQVRKILDYLN